MRQWINVVTRNLTKTLKNYSFGRNFSTPNLASNSINRINKTYINNFIKAIINEYSKQGQTFLLPWADNDAMEQIQRPFQAILNNGNIL